MSAFASAVLAPAGVHSLYGDPSCGLPVVAAPSGIAGVLARAHQVVRNAPAGVVSDGVVEILGRGHGEPLTVSVDQAANTPELVAWVRAAIRAGGARLELSVDPGSPWPAVAAAAAPDPWLSDLGDKVGTIAAAGRVVILAGPGVVRDGQVPGLHSLSTALGCGVLNTWGAKGIFHWRSLHHWATIGLQDRDFELSGIDDTDLLLVVGMDEREAPMRMWSRAPHLVLEADELGPLAELLPGRPVTAAMPPIRARLAAATQSGWQSTEVPIAPSRVTLHYGRLLSPGGFIAADAGPAGFWVARTFGTTQLGSVAVPPYVDPGWAVACVTVARLADRLRPALAVVDSVDDVTGALLEYSRSLGIPIGLEVWDGAGEKLSAESHEARLQTLIDPVWPDRPGTLATDEGQLDAFVEAAGPVREWKPPVPAA